LSEELKLQTTNRLYPPMLYKGVVWQNNHKLLYLGMQDQFHTFNMFDCQAWFARDVIMQKIKIPNNAEVENDIKKWVSMEEKLENPDQMIDFQTEYTKELHEMSDYPKIDFELIRKHFKEWEHHKVENIMTYRNKSFSSPVTGSVAPVHHTPWESAMDDSLKTFLNK
jgi:trimethylamine monooxygenase